MTIVSTSYSSKLTTSDSSMFFSLKKKEKKKKPRFIAPDKHSWFTMAT